MPCGNTVFMYSVRWNRACDHSLSSRGVLDETPHLQIWHVRIAKGSCNCPWIYEHQKLSNLNLSNLTGWYRCLLLFMTCNPQLDSWLSWMQLATNNSLGQCWQVIGKQSQSSIKLSGTPKLTKESQHKLLALPFLHHLFVFLLLNSSVSLYYWITSYLSDTCQC